MEIGLIYLLKSFPFMACIVVCNHTFVVIVAFFVILEILHILAFWWPSLVAYGHCILWCVCCRWKCEIFLTWQLPRHCHSMFAYLVSTSVSVLEVNAMGLLFCSNAVPSQYSLESHLSAWLMVVFYHSRLRLFSKECCRFIALIVEMVYL